IPAYAMGPRAAMKPSGAPTIRKSTHARRRAHARCGSWRHGPRGSYYEARGRFRELAITTPTTRIGLDKGDDDNIRNDKRHRLAERTADVTSRLGRENWVSSGPCGEKTKSFAVISSHSNEGMLSVPPGQGLEGLASHAFTSSRGRRVRRRSRPAHCRKSESCHLPRACREPVCRHRESARGR